VIAGGEADIIIGTQIVAKGHNFPLLTLVGVIDADLGLQGSDLRAAERTFQLMRQVAGRAGRADRKGEALLQTHQPDHPVIRAILGGDEEAFWRAEAAERRAAGVPPYGRMAGIILSSPDVAAVFDFGGELARRIEPLRRIGAEVFGPAPAPIARVRGRHRVRLLVKAGRGPRCRRRLPNGWRSSSCRGICGWRWILIRRVFCEALPPHKGGGKRFPGRRGEGDDEFRRCNQSGGLKKSPCTVGSTL
jgi:primosomal protein N'